MTVSNILPSFDPEDDFADLVRMDPELSDLMDDEDRRTIIEGKPHVIHEEVPDHYGYNGDFWSDR